MKVKGQKGTKETGVVEYDPERLAGAIEFVRSCGFSVIAADGCDGHDARGADDTDEEQDGCPYNAMDVTEDDGNDARAGMVPCPKCGRTDTLRVLCDIASLNSLEYWVECDGCGFGLDGRECGADPYADSAEEMIALWNAHAEEVAMTREAE